MKKFRLVIFFLIMLLLFFLDRQGGLNFIKRPFQNILVPVQYGFYNLSTSITSKLEIAFSIGALYDDNRKLREQNAILTADNARLGGLAEENETLKEQIGTNSKRTVELIAASVIGFGPTSDGKHLLIDMGEENGVKKDALVILRDILIGKVVSISPRSARVRLLTDPASKVPAVTESKAKGLLVGQFQAEMRLTDVLPEEDLRENDAVLTSGEGNYPKDLVIGKVEKVKKNDKDIFQEATVKPLLNYNKLNLVFVIK